ncbi:MAG: tetratricopeptide repeat protein [Planctomycetaceae bacterium]
MKLFGLPIVAILALLPGLTTAQIAVSEPPESAVSEQDLRAQKLAVTLNYCHAALHRIRGAGSVDTVREEQLRILNNIDLNQINDPEVIALYRSILEEIGTLQISTREQQVISDGFQRDAQRKMGTDLFVMGAQAATGQLGSLIQTGAASWWDYRNTQARADAEHWKVERGQLQSVLNRSSTFLDSFWKLSRDNNIPDRWLLRSKDLDKLSENLSITDPETRLRALERQERFMQCYPPYWYYVARTQQKMGNTAAAEVTFRKLVEIGKGHFRQDDMLAGSLANLALMQESRQDRTALLTAQEAWEQSSVNWEANLICAAIMSRHQRYDLAEELLLCNVEESLEEEQSAVSLVWLYHATENRQQLAKMLQNPRYVSLIPIPGLLLCAQQLGSDNLPDAARTQLASTLTASPGRNGGVNTISVAAVHSWKLNEAEATITAGPQIFSYASYRQTETRTEVAYTPSLRSNVSRDPISGDLVMSLRYPSTPPVEVTLCPSRTVRAQRRNPPRISGVFGPLLGPPAAHQPNAAAVYKVSEIRIADLRLTFELTGTPLAQSEPSQLAADDDFRRPTHTTAFR